MPNWCQNRLVVGGPKDAVAKFRKDNELESETPVDPTDFEGLRNGTAEMKSITVPLGFGAMVPEPPEGDPRRVPSDTCMGGWDWYRWRIDNWGTKWELSADTRVEEGVEGAPENVLWDSEIEHGLTYSFDTAWGPPAEWFSRVAPLYPELKMKLVYVECGMDFKGALSWDGEEVVDGEVSIGTILELDFGSYA